MDVFAVSTRTEICSLLSSECSCLHIRTDSVPKALLFGNESGNVADTDRVFSVRKYWTRWKVIMEFLELVASGNQQTSAVEEREMMEVV